MKRAPAQPTDQVAGKPGWRSRIGLQRLRRRMAVRDWLAIVAALILLALALGWQNGLGRLDQTLYDKLLSASAQPHRDDIIIIAI